MAGGPPLAVLGEANGLREGTAGPMACPNRGQGGLKEPVFVQPGVEDRAQSGAAKGPVDPPEGGEEEGGPRHTLSSDQEVVLRPQGQGGGDVSDVAPRGGQEERGVKLGGEPGLAQAGGPVGGVEAGPRLAPPVEIPGALGYGVQPSQGESKEPPLVDPGPPPLPPGLAPGNQEPKPPGPPPDGEGREGAENKVGPA